MNRRRTSRVAASLATVAAALAAVTVVGTSPTQAAFSGTTTFEIDGDLVQNDVPPDGGVDWDNAEANGIRDVATSEGLETCAGAAGIEDPDEPGEPTFDETSRIKQGTALDDIEVDDDLASLIEAKPVPTKADLCKVTLGWELVEVGGDYQFVLYGSWSRPDVQGEINVLIPLLGGDDATNDDDVVLSYDFDDSTQSTTLTALTWSGTGWVEDAVVTLDYDADTGTGGTDPDFDGLDLTIGEFAVNLTTSGFLPNDDETCTTFTTGPVLTRTGNDGSATLKDVVGALPVTLTNCGTIVVEKVALPTPAEATEFDWIGGQRDWGSEGIGGTLTVPGDDTDSVQVPISPDWWVNEVLPLPDGWYLRSLECTGTDPISGGTFTETMLLPWWFEEEEQEVDLPQFPVGPGDTVTCTITNVGPPTLTLAKVTEGGAGGPFLIQADITHPQEPDLQAAADDTIVAELTTTEPGTPVSETHTLQSGDVVEVREIDPLAPNFEFVSLECVTTGLELPELQPESIETDQDVPIEFTVAAGDAVVCTATNRALRADLALQKLVNGDDADAAPGVKVNPGDTITYAIQVNNLGPDAAVDAVVSDPIPANLTDVAVVDDGPYSCAIAAGTLTCTIAEHPSGVTATITLTAKVSASAPGAMAILNQATVTAATPDPDPSNNTDPAYVTVKSADLAVTKVPDGRTLTSGETFDWNITITNAGPDDAANAVVTDVLPASLVNSTVVDDGPYTCSIASGTLTCTIASHPVGVTATIVLRSTAPASSASAPLTITNTASVRSDTPDPNLNNNSDPGSVIVPQQASAPPPPPEPAPVPLPATGNDPSWLLRIGVLLALAGGSAVLVTRRRRTS